MDRGHSGAVVGTAIEAGQLLVAACTGDRTEVRVCLLEQYEAVVSVGERGRVEE